MIGKMPYLYTEISKTVSKNHKIFLKLSKILKYHKNDLKKNLANQKKKLLFGRGKTIDAELNKLAKLQQYLTFEIIIKSYS
jgi:hypothetical protein